MGRLRATSHLVWNQIQIQIHFTNIDTNTNIRNTFRAENLLISSYKFTVAFRWLGVCGTFGPWTPSTRQPALGRARLKSGAFGQNTQRGLRPEYM